MYSKHVWCPHCSLMTIVYHYGHVSRSLNPYLLAGKYVEIMSCRAETLNIFRGKCTCCFLGLQLLVWYEVILFNVLTDIMCSWWSPCMLWMVLFCFFLPQHLTVCWQITNLHHTIILKRQFFGATVVGKAKVLPDSCGGSILYESGVCLTGVGIQSGPALEGFPS